MPYAMICPNLVCHITPPRLSRPHAENITATPLPVDFVTAAPLVHDLMEARDDKPLLRLQRQPAEVKLPILPLGTLLRNGMPGSGRTRVCAAQQNWCGSAVRTDLETLRMRLNTDHKQPAVQGMN